MYYTVYKITNNINEKYYIGMHQTNNLEDGYMGSGKLISRAINKYGIENFSKIILHIFDNEEDMKNKEKELVVISENTYNLMEGGEGGFGYINSKGLADYKKAGKKGSDIQRELMKDENWYNFWYERYKNSRYDPKVIEKIKKGLKKARSEGRIPYKQLNSFESIEKKKETYKKNKHQQGQKNSQYDTCWITNGKENKKIKKEDLDYYIKKGYNKGRIIKGLYNASQPT